MGPTGNFSGGGITAFIGLLDMGQANSALNVSLIYPAANSGAATNSVMFTYEVEDNNTVSNCTLYIDGVQQGFSSSIILGQNTFDVNDLSIASHVWNVTCRDVDGIAGYSVNHLFTVFSAVTFNISGTNLSQVDVRNVVNLTLSRTGIGKIVFDDPTDISGGGNLDAYVRILDNSIIIDSSALPALNKSAVLTMYNVPYNSIILWKDGAVCTSCNILSHTGGTLSFSVESFSNYTVTGNSRLYIYSDTDSFARYIGQNVTFTANYSNITSGQPISGACNISFSIDGWANPAAMIYDGHGLYIYNRSFNATGLASFNVSCAPSSSGYDALSAMTTYRVSGTAGSFADVDTTIISSSRMNVSSGAANISSEAGNVTELVVNGTSVSRSWQGYYGNVTGNIVLTDTSKNKLYDWELVSPLGEIYASRTSAVSWYDIRCANIGELHAEDAYLGMNEATDGESIMHTFFNTTSFRNFYTSIRLINSSQNCYATNLYNDTGAQNNAFAEILLSDNHNMVYAGLIDSRTYGFDNMPHDFEMIVGEPGKYDNTPTAYYFFVEIG